MPNEMLDLKQAVARYGAEAKAKLANPSATGAPEGQLRAPLEGLFGDLAELCGFKREWVTAVGRVVAVDTQDPARPMQWEATGLHHGGA